MKRLLVAAALLLLVPTSVLATVLYRYESEVTTTRGDAVGSATVTVYLEDTTTKAALYQTSSVSGATQSNPLYTNALGRYSFFIEPGIYDIQISGLNLTTYTVESVVIGPHGYRIANAAAGDSVPSVAGLRFLAFPDSVTYVSLDSLTDGVANQIITLFASGSAGPPTVLDAAAFILSADWTPSAGGTLTLFTPDGDDWYEVSRSAN